MAAGDASLSRPKLQGWSLPVKSMFVVLLWTSVNLAATSEKSGCGELKGEEVCCGGRKYHRDFDRVCCSLRGYPEGEFTYMVKIRCKNGSTNDPLETCGPRQFDNRYEDCCDKVCFDRQTYKCCTGSTGSTVVGLETACCDGHGLKPGEMCCQADVDMVIINKTNPAHTSCCVPLDNTDIQKEKHRIETQTQDPKALFTELDANSDHFLTENELMLFFTRADHDGNGKVTFQEYAHGIPHDVRHTPEVQGPFMFYDNIDGDTDNVLLPKDITISFNKMDANNDSKVTSHEFFVGMRKMQVGMQAVIDSLKSPVGT
ncbi:hypothetical protein ACOMHN_040466 [Nucella lapillus]